MKLNDHSYAHIKIKKLCQILAYYSEMQLLTDLSNEFKQIKFASRLSYITIDYQKHVCFAMSHKLTKREQDTIEEIMLYLDWLETGNRYRNRHKRLRSVTKT